MSRSRQARLLLLAIAAVAAVLALTSFDACAGGPACALSSRLIAESSGRRLASPAGGEGPVRQGQIRWAGHPSKCLDVRDGLAENGNHLQLWDCLEASPGQQFTWSSSDKKLRWAAHPEYCVDIFDHENSNGNFVQLWQCGATNPDQSFDVSASVEGRIRWSTHPEKCIDVRDHSAANGNTIQIWACQADNTDQLFTFGDSSATPTTPMPDDSEAYDIIVVGGGLVGSVVATRLAEDLPGQKVLLVEAGRASQKAVGGTEPPASWDSAGKRWVEWPGLSTLGLTKYDVPGNYERLQCWRQDCDESWGREVPAFQCKVLGGCGVMNGALMQVPNAAMFDSWPAGWRHADLASHLESAQALFEITPKPSRDGKHYLDGAGEGFVELALSRGGFSSGSTRHPEPKTMGLPEVTAKGGVRQSTTSEMLPRAMRLGNFELMLEAEVLSISHTGGTANGVTVRRQGQAPRTVRLKAGGHVVLSAGALNTPRLLLASGVTGDGAVGSGVSDHTLVSLIYKVPSSVSAEALAGVSQAYGLPPDSAATSQYASSLSGPLAQYGPTLLAFFRHPDSTGPPEAIDVEAWVNPVTQPGEVHTSLVLMRPTCPKATLYLDGGRLRQRGGTNLACSRDREVMDFAIKELDRLLGKAGARRMTDSPSAMAMNHWVGSCALGSCASPATLAVRGTSNIAVADASLIPEQVWGHPALTLTALGFKAAEILTATVPK